MGTAVRGTGLALGLSDGTNNAGLYADPVTLGADAALYNEPKGTVVTPSGSGLITNAGLGVTTVDAESGLETDLSVLAIGLITIGVEPPPRNSGLCRRASGEVTPKWLRIISVIRPRNRSLRRNRRNNQRAPRGIPNPKAIRT